MGNRKINKKMTQVELLQVKLISTMEKKLNQRFSVQEYSHLCYWNNMKWFIEKNLFMKKYAEGSFQKPNFRHLNLKKIDTASTSCSQEGDEPTSPRQIEDNSLKLITTNSENETEILQQKTDTNQVLDNYSYNQNANQLSSDFNQLPEQSTNVQIIDREDLRNCNNSTENTTKIDNELEKQQRKELIMDQLESLAKQKEALQRKYNQISEMNSYNLTQNKKPTVLNLTSNLASKKIMTKISSFSAQVTNILTKEQKRYFNKFVDLFFDWLELNNDCIKEFMSESIAQVILYLVACNIGINKKDFINNLKPNVKTNRNKPKIENIKKLLCYPIWKSAF